ncbi:GNAT family N-acetyltransferase [Weissella sagaensis]|uniref:GNAT family N-acetyltransferase n=1 Tax=Weissella sagaensis TaxID=2559928 RepID=UPI00214AE35D|nr:GNAT family N-acetyltransferase [Weissella sagaensis]
MVTKKIAFKLANVSDANKIIKMYKMGFKTLFETYQDTKTNPYMESKDDIYRKINQNNSYYFFILQDQHEIGLIRVMLDSEDTTHAKISPILILPEFENKGFAQMALLQIEEKFSSVKQWYIDTIKQETKLLHLYTKSGYILMNQPELYIKEGMDLVFLTKSTV